MKPIRYLHLCMLVLFTVIVSCQQEDQVPIEAPKATIRRIITADDIPEVKQTLLRKVGLSNDTGLFTANTGETTSDLKINWERIKQVVDSTGVETYAFGLQDLDNDPTTFYNLVMRYNADHQAHTPYILKYKMAESFAAAYYQTGSLEGFRGSVQKIIINQQTSGTPRGSANIDAGNLTVGNPCPTKGSVGGGDGGTEVPEDGDFNLTCETFVVTHYWHSTVCYGGGCETTTEISSVSLHQECSWDAGSSSVDADDSCKPDEGEVPIIEPISVLCDDDPLTFMKITDYNSSKNANRFGCVRVSSSSSCAPGKKNHNGIDLDAEIGTNVHAIYDGTIYARGTQVNSAGVDVGWGHWLMIKSTIAGKEYFHLYAHLDALPTITGNVTAGSLIGLSGDSGNAENEPHLHVEFREFKEGVSYNNSIKVDPENFLGATFDEHGNTNWDITCD